MSKEIKIGDTVADVKDLTISGTVIAISDYKYTIDLGGGVHAYIPKDEVQLIASINYYNDDNSKKSKSNAIKKNINIDIDSDAVMLVAILVFLYFLARLFIK